MVVCIVPCSTNPFASLLSPCSWRSVVSLSFSICCLLVPEGLLSPCSLRSVVSCSLRSVVFLSLVVFLLSACLWWSFCCLLVSDGLSVVCLSLMVFLLYACLWWSFCCFIVTGGMCFCLLVPGGLLCSCFWGSVCCCLVPECLSAVSLPLRVCVLSPFHWGSVLSPYHWGSVLCLCHWGSFYFFLVTEGLCVVWLSLEVCS